MQCQITFSNKNSEILKIIKKFKGVQDLPHTTGSNNLQPKESRLVGIILNKPLSLTCLSNENSRDNQKKKYKLK